MLKRNRKMQVNTGALLFNAAGVLIGLVIAGSYLSNVFESTDVPACTERYPTAMQYALDGASGAALTPIELQSRAGRAEWGVLENAAVVRVPGAPTPSIMEVKLAKPANTAPEGTNVAGIGMSWVPHALNRAGSGCLTYSLYLPDNFEYGEGGTLPGLYGGPRPDTLQAPSGAADSFYSRPLWNRDGYISLALQISGEATPNNFQFLIDRFVLPRGRWVRFQQEVVLNKPDNADGIVRLWIDGKLRLERTDVVWRHDDAKPISGVLFDVTAPATAKPSALRLSAPVLGWKAG